MLLELWHWLNKVATMPSTIGGQLTIIVLALTLGGLVWRGLHNVMEHLRWIELLWLEYAKQNGTDVPEWLMKKHMKVNGNARHYREIAKGAAAGKEE